MPCSKFPLPLAFRLMGQFLILISLLQKRIRLDFDESDEEEMAVVPACSTVASGQPSEVGDARVRRHDSRFWRASSFSRL